MSKNARRLYGEISKSEKQDDGTIKVWGYASAECVDSDGETITADAMRGARDGYMAFANVREMHDPKKAAGVAIDYEVQEDGRTWFGAHVVDPVAVLKVETGVYKGFSIGAKVPKGGRDGKVIKAIELREVSLVDRPANPEAVFTLVKAEGADTDEDEGDDEGAGENLQKSLSEVGDLANVLQSLGWITGRVGWEAQAEGDASPIPARMVEWLKAGASILADMAAEESAELVANLQAIAAPAQAAAKADDSADLTKAGKRFSGATKKALKAAHDACKAADTALSALGYDADDADEGAEDEAGKAAAAQEQADELAKRAADEAAQVDEIAKAAGLTVESSTAQALAKAAVSDLLKTRATLAELLKRAAPAKGHTGAGIAIAKAIAKAADRDEDGEQIAPVVKADGSTDDVATLIKAAHLQPVRLS